HRRPRAVRGRHARRAAGPAAQRTQRPAPSCAEAAHASPHRRRGADGARRPRGGAHQGRALRRAGARRDRVRALRPRARGARLALHRPGAGRPAPRMSGAWSLRLRVGARRLSALASVLPRSFPAGHRADPVLRRGPEAIMHDPNRYFTVEEANRTLPLVRRIVEDIVALYPAFQEQLRSFQELAGTPLEPPVEERLQQLRVEIDRSAQQINGYIQELQQVGCLFKGFDEGLVDFYSYHEGRPIFLCWKLGEERITHWHELDAGAAGRQPLTPEMVAGNGSA